MSNAVILETTDGKAASFLAINDNDGVGDNSGETNLIKLIREASYPDRFNYHDTASENRLFQGRLTKIPKPLSNPAPKIVAKPHRSQTKDHR